MGDPSWIGRSYRGNVYRKFHDVRRSERRQFSPEDYHRSIAYKQKHDKFPMKERSVTVQKKIDLPEKFEDEHEDWVCEMCFSFEAHITINAILARKEIRFGEVYEGITTQFSTTCNSMDIIREGKIPFRGKKLVDTLSRVSPDNPKFEFVTVHNTPESLEEIFHLDVSDLVDAFEEIILSNDYILGSDPSLFATIP